MRQLTDKHPPKICSRERENFHCVPHRREFVKDVPGLAHYTFPEDSAYPYPDGYYVPAGGVFWPEYIPGEGLTGYAVCGGFHLSTRTVYLFSERKFVVIGDREGYPQDAPPPLKPWIETCWEQFLNVRYYIRQPELSTNRFVTESARVFNNRPRPAFPKVHWTEFASGMQTVHEYHSLDRFRYFPGRYEKETHAYEAEVYENGPNGLKKTYPAIYSVCLLLNGLDMLANNEYLIDNMLIKLGVSD